MIGLFRQVVSVLLREAKHISSELNLEFKKNDYYLVWRRSSLPLPLIKAYRSARSSQRATSIPRLRHPSKRGLEQLGKNSARLLLLCAAIKWYWLGRM